MKKSARHGYTDPASKYANDVLDGQIVACSHIKNAAERHFQDLAQRKYLWRPQDVDHVIDFMTHCCYVFDHVEQKHKPIQLMPYQQFILYSLHAWRIKRDDPNGRIAGTRRFTKLFLSSGKSAGKSGFCAAHLLYQLTQDRYPNLDTGEWIRVNKPKIIISASTLTQARSVGLQPAIDMVRNCDLFENPSQGNCEVVGGIGSDRIICKRTGGVLEAISGRKSGTGLGGEILTGVHMEEISETNDFDRWNNLVYGLKMTPQPLISIATNPSDFTSGLAYREYENAIACARGEGQDGTLALVYQTDDEHYPQTVMVKDWALDESLWEQANPGHRHGIPRKDYITRQIDQAKTPKQRRDVWRLNFGCWKSYGNGLISNDQLLQACLPKGERIAWEDMKSHPLYLGLDLASRNDLTALAYLWQDGDQYWHKVHAYTANDTLPTRSLECGVDMQSFRDAGWINANAGQVVDFRHVVKDILLASQRFDLKGVALDMHGFHQLTLAFTDMGVPFRTMGEGDWLDEQGILLIPHAQGSGTNTRTKLGFESSICAFEQMVLAEQGKTPVMKMQRNPVMAWAVDSSIVKQNPATNRRHLAKRDAKNHSNGKIDVLVATLMACGLAHRGVLESEYISSFTDYYTDKDFDPNRYVM